MHYQVVFYDLADKYTEEISADHPLTCREAAAIVLGRKGKPVDRLQGLVYRTENTRLSAESVIPEGECLSIHRLLGGG